MAKKKKPTVKGAGPRRNARRGKQPTETEGEAPACPSAAEPGPGSSADAPALPIVPAAGTSADVPAPPAAEPASAPALDSSNLPNTDQATATNPSVPIVVLHKKFGKYRCLFNNDEKKCDLGSDSETSSSVEIRVVDPCASSESDSNAALESHSDSASMSNCSPIISTIRTLTSNSEDNSPTPAFNLSELQLPPMENTESVSDNTDTVNVQQSQSPIDQVLDKIELPNTESSLDKQLTAMETETNMSQQESGIQLPFLEYTPLSNTEELTESHIPSAEGQADEVIELEDDDDDDEEVITVVQIVEDDNPEYYYDIQISSPKDATNETEAQKEDTSNEPINEFQQHFEKLNLASSVPDMSSPMDCTEMNDSNRSSVCNTPDLLAYLKESSSDQLVRPDPSLTPSSTLSDDSNSSRITSEPAQNDSAESSPSGVRRSSRIKTISTLKQKTKGYGLVKTPLKKALMSQTKLKLEEIGSDSQEKMPDGLLTNASNSPTFPIPTDMPVKVKSRWRRSSELEMGAGSPAVSPLASPSLPKLPPISEGDNLLEEDQKEIQLTKETCDKIIAERMGQFVHLEENEYLCERMISKETKKMICDCFMTKEETDRGELGCGEDCLNRLLMIECNYRCPVGDRCTNRRFQKKELAPLKVFYADKKGCGVESSEEILSGEFLMEYIGEVLDYEQFYKRAQEYSDENNLHHYFMSLKGDTVIDATMKGNISRFINHSCDPNAETQKWTVNGELRIGFFSKRDIVAGEEITFDYQFQRFGKEAQRCYCGASNCRGWIGAEPDSDEEEEEDDVSTSKSVQPQPGETEQSAGERAPAPRRAPRPPRRKYTVPAPDLVQDADIEEDIESLTRSGIKNQSHTLRLSRTVVRAKTRRAQTSLLRLLRDADLPCRRLFLDYRGLRLLGPWCHGATPQFRLEMLQTLDRLPIPNKTMLQESRLLSMVQRWLSADPLSLDVDTSLPLEPAQELSPDKSKDGAALQDKVKDLCKQLLERWSSLKEVFKIPKKERIQQMKEHERQANVERRAADSSGSRERERERNREERDRRDDYRERERDRERERERDKYRERERERDRERERERDDRDRRKRRGSPEGGRRSIRLNERVLTAVPPMSKEERRRAFAEAAAAAEESRRQADAPPRWPPYAQWPGDSFPQMYPGGMMGAPPGLMPALPPGLLPGVVPGLLADEWPAEFPPGYCPPYAAPQFVMPQHNFMGMGGFGMGYMFGQQVPFAPPDAPPQANLMPQPEQCPPADECAAVLPSLWRSAVDARGRTYYYHVKLRQPQWAPPPPPATLPDESSSEEEMDAAPATVDSSRRHGKFVEGVNGIYEVKEKGETHGLIPDHALVSASRPRKRRPGLVTERPISPRTEEDKLAGRLEVKRYKETKEKLRRRREKLLQKVRLLQQATKKKKDKEITVQDLKMVDLVDTDSDSSDCDEVSEQPQPEPEPEPEAEPEPEPEPGEDPDEAARRIKEVFRSTMARVMVAHLNPYRHRTAPAGRITNTSDFKHLARKLTHFVMLKELKHCRSVDELVVTSSVQAKAKEFVRKYMCKFGPVYKRPAEEAD